MPDSLLNTRLPHLSMKTKRYLKAESQKPRNCERKQKTQYSIYLKQIMSFNFPPLESF